MNLKFYTSAFLLISLLATVTSCKEEDPPQQYMRGGNALVLADDGNLVIAGYNTNSTKGYDANLLKVSSSNGDTIWNRKFGGSYSDAFFSVKKANNGGYIAAGFSNKANASSPAMSVVITDNNGNLVKSTTYGSSNSSQGFSILPHKSADSGYLVAGYIQKTGRTDRDIYLVKIDNAGIVQWEKTIGARSQDSYDTVHDAAYCVIAAADSGYYLTGSLNGNTSCCGKIFLMKVSPTGDSLWTRTFATGIGHSLTLTTDGGIAIGGTIQETDNHDIIVLKTDADGNLQWSKISGGTGYEYGATMIETADGGFAITGITSSKGSGYDDFYLIKLNSTGMLEWDRTYGGADTDQGYGLVEYGSGGFSITGLTNTGGSYIYVNRISADGTQQWFKNIQ